MDPASSSDEDEESPLGNHWDEDEGGAPPAITSFNDLPSDDSVSLDDGDENDREDEEELPLRERVLARRQNGLPNGAREDRKKNSERREARRVAAQRLEALRREREKRDDGPVEIKKKNKKKDGDAFFQDESENESDDEAPEQSSSQSIPLVELKRKKTKKKSKHTPTEASSKRSDYYDRGAPDLNSSGIGVAVGSGRYKPRDPRMQSLSGHLDQDAFERNYHFLEEVQDKEIEQLKQRIEARKVTGRKGQKRRRKLGLMGETGGSLEEDQANLAHLIQERSDRRQSQVQRAAKRAVKKKIRDDVAAGKRGAYHLKRSEMKRLELEAKFDELRKRGGDAAVDKALAKRRKKNLSKESRYMPPKGT